MSTPEQIQQNIERTRSALSNDVERLGEKVSPGKVVGRRVDRVKQSTTSLRHRVMGDPAQGSGLRGAAQSAKGTVGSAAAGVSDNASSVGEAVANAPQAVTRQAQGNPLAAGLIAFGAGWLLASLAPATRPEQQLAQRVEDHASELAEPLKERAQDMAAQLKEPAQQAVEQVKSTATDAAGETADQVRSGVDDVRRQATP